LKTKSFYDLATLIHLYVASKLKTVRFSNTITVT